MRLLKIAMKKISGKQKKFTFQEGEKKLFQLLEN